MGKGTCLWRCGGHWWLHHQLPLYSCLCQQHPRLILLLLWQRDRKCPPASQRGAVCGTGDALTSICSHGHWGWAEAEQWMWGAQQTWGQLSCCFVTGAQQQLSWGTCLASTLSGGGERRAVVGEGWERDFWVFQRERGVILFFLNPLNKKVGLQDFYRNV